MLRILHLLLRSGEGAWLLTLCVLQCSVLNSIKLVKVTVPGMINLLLVKKLLVCHEKNQIKVNKLFAMSIMGDNFFLFVDAPSLQSL